jgi:hypothetical protein
LFGPLVGAVIVADLTLGDAAAFAVVVSGFAAAPVDAVAASAPEATFDPPTPAISPSFSLSLVVAQSPHPFCETRFSAKSIISR